MAGRKARLRNPGRLSRKNRAGAVFAKVERRTKTPGVRAYRHLFVLVTSHSAASGAAYVASASRRRRATPRRRVLVFTVAALSRCARAAAPPLCHHSSAPNRSRAGHTVARLERVRTAATLERRAQSVWQGRSLYPTASSQPTARGRAPARLRALERAPCRAPCRAPGPNPGLLPLRWADWRSASWDMRLIMR